MVLGCLVSSSKSFSSSFESSPTNLRKSYVKPGKSLWSPARSKSGKEDLPSPQAKDPLSGNDTFRANYPWERKTTRRKLK